MATGQGESKIRTHQCSRSSQELSWSLKARSLRALAPLALSHDLVSRGLPIFLIGN